MSKVARKPIELPDNTKFSLSDNMITIEGPKGTLSFLKQKDISVKEEEGKLHIATSNNDSIALSGTTRALLSNMVYGVSNGWEKTLKLIGVGYRAKADKNFLELTVGY